MFDSLVKKWGADKDLPVRASALMMLKRVLDGTIYDKLRYDFHQEKNGSGEYVKLAERKPSVRYNLASVVVDDAVSLLFGEGRFPEVRTADGAVNEVLDAIIEETGLCEVMQDAAIKGSVGSVALWMRVLAGRVFFDVMETMFLTPEWNPDAPDTLLRVVERYKVKGSDLAANGYIIPSLEMGVMFWFQRAWDTQAETWYVPQKLADAAAGKPPLVDQGRTVEHLLGFVPIVWIKNLPGGNEIDGRCTFAGVINSQIEIDYQLSQAGRGLKYSSDPTLMIKEPAGDGEGPITKGGGNALIVSENGDAKMLEINGSAASAVIDYVKTLREFGLEAIHGNRSSADKMALAQSGRALELLHQPLIWLADKMRTTYGARGLLPLMRMTVAARRRMNLKLNGEDMPDFPDGVKLRLVWPSWFHPTSHDMLEESQRVVAYWSGGLLSRESAVTGIQESTGVQDVPQEIAKIDADNAVRDARAKALAAGIKGDEPPAA